MNYFSIPYNLVTLHFYLILCDVVLSRSQAEQSSTHMLITVKTTGSNHWSRLIDLIDTWYQFDPQNTYFVSDADDEAISRKTQGHLLNSGCGVGHDVSSLCCKMGFELRIALKHRAKWWCHFDDDNYVNVFQLQSLLNGLNSRRDYYLGKISTSSPDLRQLDNRELPNQISLSSRGNNRVAVPEISSNNQDYTGFRSLHCYLFPYLCKNVS
ncbi:fringe-like domain-containing protein [Ditylenchus destructor]|uniref:Fringe-like domain-containing protein n=1 Tax=Ditylenchus destructor TaxID=166010 RepID=A0AAD4N383_9BILA|nr:fringe-like domain-containing protein [Ditylenchus destructor]